MNLKNKISELFPEAVPLKLPSWLEETIEKNNSTIKSYLWETESIRRIRLCKLDIKNKFKAETLVIYPDFCYETPILGTEYLNINNSKFVGAVDLHPLKVDTEYNQKYITNYMQDLPDRSRETSKIYDLNKYFSKKFWIKKNPTDFYSEYSKVVDEYILRFKSCLKDSQKNNSSYPYHVGYDKHLAKTDPAYGILKAHFDKDFAEKYISSFLFDLYEVS